MAPSYVVAVMGATGAGKSSFIKLVTGNEMIKVGHSLQSETSKITGYNIVIRGRKYVLVDTPGFDDTCLSDSDVLKMLADWLASSYRSGTKLSAILYVHPISQTRMQGTALRNLTMFKQLCGEGFYQNITFGSSCWSIVANDIAIERERELKSHPKFWKPMISRGSKVVRLPESTSAARDLITEIANHEAIALQIQTEMVVRRVAFDQLAATKVLNIEIEKLRKQHAADKKKLLEEQRKREEQQRQRRLEMQREAEKKAREARVQHHADVRRYCANKRPFGSCDKCKSTLKAYNIIYHCCSCNKNDYYWHCGSCGNDCGNDEHPYMSSIDNSDSCIMM